MVCSSFENMKKRCAIVGIGNRTHSWLSGIVEQHPECTQLVGLCDLNLDRCRDVNAAYGTTAAVYDNYDRMLAEVKPDLVIVVSPESCHREHIVKALEAGCHVATEKPLCTTIEDADAIVAAERRSGKKVFMAFNYRHIPLCSKIREIIKAGTIGRPVSMDLTWYLDYKGHGAKLLPALASTHARIRRPSDHQGHPPFRPGKLVDGRYSANGFCPRKTQLLRSGQPVHLKDWSF